MCLTKMKMNRLTAHLYLAGRRRITDPLDVFSDFEEKNRRIDSFIRQLEKGLPKRIIGLKLEKPFIKTGDAKFPQYPAHRNWGEGPLGNFLIGPILNQHETSNSFAFASVNAIESLIFFKTKRRVMLSKQQVIDWLNSHHGGRPTSVLHLAMTVGICCDAAYPYVGFPRLVNPKLITEPTIKIDGFRHFRGEDEMMTTIQESPFIGHVQGSEEFYNHRGGVFFGVPKRNTNHAFFIYGYSHNRKGTRWWLAKNSMGNKWCEEGTIRMLRYTNDRFGSNGVAIRGLCPFMSDVTAQQNNKAIDKMIAEYGAEGVRDGISKGHW